MQQSLLLLKKYFGMYWKKSAMLDSCENVTFSKWNPIYLFLFPRTLTERSNNFSGVAHPVRPRRVECPGMFYKKKRVVDWDIITIINKSFTTFYSCIFRFILVFEVAA